VSDTDLSVVLSFDGSMLYEPDNATPTAAGVGYVVRAGRPLVEGARGLSAFVSSTHVEYRALVAGARAAANLHAHREVVGVHVEGDAAAVIEAADPDHPAVPGDDVMRRRVRTVRRRLSFAPTVTYRHVGRERVRRAHELARRGVSRGSD